MLSQILQYLLEAFFGFFVFLLLLRFLMQQVKAPFQNPIGQFVCALTDWIVVPLRRVIPPLYRIDLATILSALLIETVLLFLLYLVRSSSLAGISGSIILFLFAVAVIKLIQYFIYLIVIAVLVSVIISWVNPHAPMAPIFYNLTRPFMRPFQRLVPPIGGFDLSPIFVVVVAQVLLIILDRVSFLIMA